jgi:hypothetical protein
MTPEEFKVKVEELRALVVEKMTELEEDPNWGTAEEREEVALAIDELIVQAQTMSDTLQEGQ